MGVSSDAKDAEICNVRPILSFSEDKKRARANRVSSRARPSRVETLGN